MSHARRAVLRGSQPVHVTLRLRAEVGSVRNRRGFALVRQVMGHVASRSEEFRIVHLSIQGNHLHLMCNWRKHGFAAGAATVLDPYSTARHFRGWLEQRQMAAVPRGDEDVLPEVPPRTWLLRVGWQRGGPPPSVFEVPSARG